MKTRAKALEYLKSAREKGTVQDLTLCLKHDDFLNVNFLHINGTCPGEVHPSSQQLDARLICRQGIAQTCTWMSTLAASWKAGSRKADPRA